MSDSHQLTAAFQGELGAFSFSAALKLLGSRANPLARPSFVDVFDSMRDDLAEFAVIPIENTLYGSVHENYDNLLKYDLKIVGETTLRIEHALITRPGLGLGDIEKAFSHPVALDQCRRFFATHPRIKPVPFYDTAGSVKMLMEENHPGAAAIASQGAAQLYGATVLLNGIEDNQDNFTRFFLLTKQEGPSPDFNNSNTAWKTSLVFTTPNTPGALSRALSCFSSRNLNLSKLESRPLRERPWEYLFYLDIAALISSDAASEALQELAQITSSLKILGCYRPTI